MNSTSKSIYRITVTAVLSALAFCLMFIEFPVPFMPPFIKFDISDLPAIFGTFAIGPLCGVLIELVKNLLHILIKGTTSAFIGELSNFLLGSVFVLVAGFIYKPRKDFRSAVTGSLLGALAMGIVCLPVNYFIVYPAYVKCYGLPLEAIIQMYCDILPKVSGIPSSNALFNCLLIFNVPFTFAKGVIDALLAIIVYTPLSKVFSKYR